MKKMFTLRGKSDCGKTSKVKGIAQWLLFTYPHAIDFDIDFSQQEIWGMIQINNLQIGFVSAGDTLECVKGVTSLLKKYPDIDIIINTCRTKGAGYRYIETNFNYSRDWLGQYINIEKFADSNSSQVSQRDNKIYNEVIAWLIGIGK